MKLIYIDPFCSGLQVVDCKSKAEIKKTLEENGLDEDQCAGEVLFYVFVDDKGETTQGELDYT